MDWRVIPSNRVTSPTWGPPPPCKQALKNKVKIFQNCNVTALIVCFLVPSQPTTPVTPPTPRPGSFDLFLLKITWVLKKKKLKLMWHQV